jgi:DNA-binding NarL/FixJ family response regulator
VKPAIHNLPAEGDLRWALQSVLEEIALPALLVDGATVVLCNAAAQGLLSRTGPEADAAVAAAARGEPNPLGLSVHAGPSENGLLLLVARQEVDLRTRRGQTASARWSLTKRQSQVLSEMILGRGNKDIAERLSCSPKTIELHVSAILAAAGVASRAELLSLLLREA